MNGPITIGIDHGYAAMKTAHFSFPTGLVAYEHEPYTQKDVLEYGGKFYVVGSGRQPLQKDKTQSEDYYLLTLAAIAKELVFRKEELPRRSIWPPGCPSPALGGTRKSFGNTCSGAASRYPSAMKVWTTSSRFGRCPCSPRATPPC